MDAFQFDEKRRQSETSHIFDQEEFRAFVLQNVLPSDSNDINDNSFNLEVFKLLHSKNLLYPVASQEFGGRALKMPELAQFFRTLGYGSCSVAGTLVATMLGFSSIEGFAERELKKRLCRKTLEDFSLWSFAMSEAEVGSDLTQTKTTARKTKDGFVINGEKNFISNARYSKHITVFAQHIDSSEKSIGISAFYIPGDAGGVTRGPSLDKMAWRKADTGTIRFENVNIPNEYLLGQPGEGFKILGRCLNRSKVFLASIAVGIADRAMDLAIERTSTTERFGKKLIDHAPIGQLFAKIYTDIYAAWALVLEASKAWETGVNSTLLSSMAKMNAAAIAANATNHALELFGTRGLLNECEISRLQRDAKSIEIVEGPTFIQQLIISRELRKLKQTEIERSALKKAV